MRARLERKGARLPLLVLATWTVAIWLTRIVNVAGADDLGVFGTLWRIVVAIVFIDLGIAAGVWALTGKLGARFFVALVALSVTYWPIRTIQILVDDAQTTAFKLVHSALALGTLAAVAFALWGVRRARRGALSEPPGAEPASA